eukprot:TRINITY_DN71647_c0_g1_i1.p5 TRINITY_DN71647_c0_g1~~TRINITY_DN71647_c0_g1_i1.p5  ORF type:complete len:169 (-),score=8.43 TRINITY_DN71647_c0_g1_i1:1275-1781(-)
MQQYARLMKRQRSAKKSQKFQQTKRSLIANVFSFIVDVLQGVADSYMEGMEKDIDFSIISRISEPSSMSLTENFMKSISAEVKKDESYLSKEVVDSKLDSCINPSAILDLSEEEERYRFLKEKTHNSSSTETKSQKYSIHFEGKKYSSIINGFQSDIGQGDSRDRKED